ncbi:7-carboxy-7-deazaguanine synthase [Vogesella indigofera]|uniref:7-carboxy-7-deazaguanine synthase n=1 Tax=Vogesella indigofera TaxID=45465 RepID=A0A495B1B7_VOGIN|nr:7-carboxy-7-deazaguanine synthase [Vogesella indigofera]MDC7692192.1 7-carboxy-7-deazaguanine synthase [Vogesella indigofera]RKQ54777.1 7-carboxy-7-deazaguanine synthase (Cx14CxxC type) [Vogesella indigofera]
MTIYTVKEIFYTLQGEGRQAGRAAVFCRFSGCNLWSGREEDRSKAICQFCDTDFVGTGDDGGKFAGAAALAARIAAEWRGTGGQPYVVFTGGEPLLQLDDALVDAMHAQGFEVAVETNGSLPAPAGIDWICVSPKAGADWVQKSGHELKLVFPQPTLLPSELPDDLQFEHYYLQPMDSPLQRQNTQEAIAWCMAHPEWRLSVQTHKVINIR